MERCRENITGMLCPRAFWRAAAIALMIPLALAASWNEALAENALGPEKAAPVLRTLAAGAGTIRALHGEFVQRKWLADCSVTITATGTVSFRAPNSVRWEYTSPARSGFVLSGNAGSSWTDAGGKSRSIPMREKSGADEAARLVVNCLAFNEAALRKKCIVDVLPASEVVDLFSAVTEKMPEYVVRLTPKNDMVRAYVTQIVLAFTPDGKRPLAAAFTGESGDRNVFVFRKLLVDGPLLEDAAQLDRLLLLDAPLGPGSKVDALQPVKEDGRLFSAMLTTARGRRLPLFLYVRATPGEPSQVPGKVPPPSSLHVAIVAEMLLRLGALDVTRDTVTLGKTVPDSHAKELFSMLGKGLGRIFLPLPPDHASRVRAGMSPEGGRQEEERVEKDGRHLWTVVRVLGSNGKAVAWQYKEPSWSLRVARIQ